MATRVFDGIKFCEQFLMRTSQGTFLSSLVKIGPALWEEKMYKEIVDDLKDTGICNKDPIDDNGLNILFARKAHKC